MGVLQTQEDRQLSEGDQGARGLMMSNLTGVFLIGFVSAMVRFALDIPMPSPNGQESLSVLLESPGNIEGGNSVGNFVRSLGGDAFGLHDTANGKDLTGGGKPDLFRGDFQTPDLMSFHTIGHISNGFEMGRFHEERPQQPLGGLAYGRLVIFQPP